MENDNFVDLILKTEAGETSLEVPVDELMSALISFDSLRSRRISLENLRSGNNS